MKRKLSHLKCGLLLLVSQLLVGKSFCQVDTSFNKRGLEVNEYLFLVGKNNLGYVAQKYNVNMAEADIETAKIFPDPQLSVGAFNNQNESLKLGYGATAGVGKTFELGGKRKARVNLAQSELELSKNLLEDYFRNLRADAATAYFLALKQRSLFQVTLDSYKAMKSLADADSIRFKAGSIMEIDARQSKLEANSLLNDVYQSEADWKTSISQLAMMVGKPQTDTLLIPSGNFEKLERDYDLYSLITTAQNNRADLKAALQNRNVSERALKLARANRALDLGVSLGATVNAEAKNIIAPTPGYTNTSLGLTIPLKFSNRYKGELKRAEYTIKQSEVQYSEVELQIQAEVTQAYLNYQATRKQVNQFKMGMLEEAKKVMDGKIYSYRRGETSLLEVLNAQRTYNDVQQSYYQTLYNYATSLIELERAGGIWDIQ
ncbi:TolC family protein [Chitinophaga sp.]|uniref:TolC family protein n=1 Tax=Chitinophaga sp. TaxID=1869181 RepID=UPI0031E0FAE0